MMNPMTHIQSTHLSKLACVYIRQSSMRQVLENTASTDVQRELVERAIALGWPRERVKMYDADLGVSSDIPCTRDGFRELAADVGMGNVGIVVGFDVTRLARNNVDWHKLIELCSICGTLIADCDGLYDPMLYNDRLLLGLKGTMSEAESHFRRMRMNSGIEKRASEGKLRKRLPVGFVYDEQGAVQLSPDESVRHAIKTVFKKFAEYGSAHRVYRFFQAEKLLFPRRRFDAATEEWGPPRYGSILLVLRNPTYAGVYTFGRCRRQKSVTDKGEIRLRTEHLKQEDWRVVIGGHHPAYVSWEQYNANQKLLTGNCLSASDGKASRVVRGGCALLQGLVRCGVCGRRMSPLYQAKGDTVRYVCAKKGRSAMSSDTCQSLGAQRLHRAVVDAFLEALSPASMQVTLAALDEIDRGDDVVLTQLLQRQERARYDVERARRQYDAVDPENRLVARNLEREWNNRLLELEKTERECECHRQQRPSPLTPEERRRLSDVGLDLERVWHADSTTNEERKLLLRTALSDVVVCLDKVSRTVVITLIWEGGATTQLDVQYPRTGTREDIDGADLVAEVRRMAEVMPDEQIAKTLSRRGLRTSKGLAFTVERVLGFRKRHAIPEYVPSPEEHGEPTYTAMEVAERLGVSLPTVLRWMKEGFLVGEQATRASPWRIRLGQIARLKVATVPPKGWLPPKKAAKVLNVSRRTVLHWVQSGQIEAVMAGKGRRTGLRINIKSRACTASLSLFDQPSDQGHV